MRTRQPKRHLKDILNDTESDDSSDSLSSSSSEDEQPVSKNNDNAPSSVTNSTPVNAAVTTNDNNSNTNNDKNNNDSNIDNNDISGNNEVAPAVSGKATRLLAGENSIVADAAVVEAAASKKKTKKKRVDGYVPDKKGRKKIESWTRKEVERHIAFCCAKCTCDKDKIKQLEEEENHCVVQAGRNSLFHRRCCHNVKHFGKSWKSPLERALHKAMPTEENLDKLDEIISEEKDATWDEIREKFVAFKKRESRIYNEGSLQDPASALDSNTEYHENRKKFNGMESDNRQPAVVLNLFGGIGSAIVALKRNGIAISRIIHVEHDKVANHVYRWNHDACRSTEYDPFSSRRIEHSFYESFEDFNEFFFNRENHFAIDILIASPPANDFTGLNPRRKGLDGEKGQYMVQVAETIGRIRDAQDHPMYFILANTLIRNQKQKDLQEGDLEQIKRALGIQWSLDFDAEYISPCTRCSTFFSNIPFEFVDSGESLTTATSCLEDDYQHPARIIQEEDLVDKSSTLMPFKSSIDDDRMLVYKHVVGSGSRRKGKYLKRTMRSSEREKITGLPLNYVTEPVNDLFTILQEKGFGTGLMIDEKEYYKDYWVYALPKEYLNFSGNYHNLNDSNQAYKFKSRVGQAIELMLAPPQVAEKPDHFTKDEYAKRLIGNAFSIPVMEALLKPLKRMFAENRYPGYDYEYEWRRNRL